MKKVTKYTGTISCITICYLLITFLSCNGSTLDNSLLQQDSSITIIVNSNLKPGLEIEYRNKFNDNQVLYANSVNDTIKLSQTAFIPLKIHYGKNNIMFPLQRGDSLFVILKSDNNLELHISNDKKKEFDTLFLKFCNKKLYQEYDQMRELLFKYSSVKPNNSKGFVVRSDLIQKDKYYNELYHLSKKINAKEWWILDSLLNENKISKRFIFVYGALINSAYINNIIQGYSQTKSEKYLRIIITDISNPKFFRPEYLKFDPGQYKDMLNNFIEQIIAKGKFHKYGSNGISIDYEEAFDSAKLYFNNKLLDYVRFICLKNIRQKSTNTEFQNYFLKFSKNTKDTSYINYFNQEFNNENSDSDILFTYSKNKKISSPINIILKQNLGKFIYIDLWASWCAPCREAMPASKKLQNQFGNKGIKFIYISIDENIADWKNAEIQEGLSEYSDSYLFANPKLSEFLKELKVIGIPRYIIVGNKGKIINSNAPPPGSDEIIRVFNELLKVESN